MKTEEILKLMKGCARFKVELKMVDLEIKLAPQVKLEAKQEVAIEGAIPTEADLREVQEKSVAQQNVEAAEDELDHILVEDPARFEQLLVERELTDDARAIN